MASWAAVRTVPASAAVMQSGARAAFRRVVSVTRTVSGARSASTAVYGRVSCVTAVDGAFVPSGSPLRRRDAAVLMPRSTSVGRPNALRRASSAAASGGGAAAAPRTASADHDVGSVTSSSTLDALRSKLDSGPDFSAFVGGGVRSGAAAAPGDAGPSKKHRHGKDPPKPSWLKITSPKAENRANFERLQKTVRRLNLATVCESAKCPNQSECWGGGDAGTATATIMIMGDTCTRGCSFCNVKTSNAPPPLDPKEPVNVATAVAEWGLDYVVLTSVDRDDLPDQGSAHFAETVRTLKELRPDMLVECLTPDFQGNADLVGVVARSGLDVFAHNLETVERLQGRVRDRRAAYDQSLGVLRAARAAAPWLITKTSLMLGVGETEDEIRATMADCLEAGVEVITFGQYLRPSSRHLPVAEYVTPESFAQWEAVGREMGFLYVASGPLVRSSYKAGEYFLQNVVKERRAAADAERARAGALA